MTTGQLIKTARKKAGMTQQDLADKLGIPFQSISQWERDMRNPKIDTLQRIAEALQVSLDELSPFTPQVIRDEANKRWILGKTFDDVVTTRMIEAQTMEERKNAQDDVMKVLTSFDSMDAVLQHKTAEWFEQLAKGLLKIQKESMRMSHSPDNGDSSEEP